MPDEPFQPLRKHPHIAIPFCAPAQSQEFPLSSSGFDLDVTKSALSDPGSDDFGAKAFQNGTGADADIMQDMNRFYAYLEQTAGHTNLVGPSALRLFWKRHAYDSAQLLLLAPQALTWIDIGSGAGFPGLVLAIFLRKIAGAKIDLIESQGKKARFLQTVVNRLDLPAKVHHMRAEDFPVQDCDIVTSRACAPLARLLKYAAPLMQRGARGLFLKGRHIELEMQEARKLWQIEAFLWTSLSDDSGRILEIKKVARV